MKSVTLTVAANLVSITLGAGAIYLAAKGITGWGWFVFGSLMTHCTVKSKG